MAFIGPSFVIFLIFILNFIRTLFFGCFYLRLSFLIGLKENLKKKKKKKGSEVVRIIMEE